MGVRVESSLLGIPECNIPKIHSSKSLAKNGFQNLFVTELKSFPAILRPDTKINHSLISMFSLFLVRIASRRRHNRLATVAANPADRRSLFLPLFFFFSSPFSLFLFLLFFSHSFSFPSPFFFPPAPCSRACARPNTLHVPGCSPCRPLSGAAHARCPCSASLHNSACSSPSQGPLCRAPLWYAHAATLNRMHAAIS